MTVHTNISSIRRWIEDQILTHIQKRCAHPGDMAAVDILEGRADFKVGYCRRCGAIRVHKEIDLGEWRLPMPKLWRGK